MPQFELISKADGAQQAIIAQKLSDQAIDLGKSVKPEQKTDTHLQRLGMMIINQNYALVNENLVYAERLRKRERSKTSPEAGVSNAGKEVERKMKDLETHDEAIRKMEGTREAMKNDLQEINVEKDRTASEIEALKKEMTPLKDLISELGKRGAQTASTPDGRTIPDLKAQVEKMESTKSRAEAKLSRLNEQAEKKVEEARREDARLQKDPDYMRLKEERTAIVRDLFTLREKELGKEKELKSFEDSARIIYKIETQVRQDIAYILAGEMGETRETLKSKTEDRLGGLRKRVEDYLREQSGSVERGTHAPVYEQASQDFLAKEKLENLPGDQDDRDLIALLDGNEAWDNIDPKKFTDYFSDPRANNILDFWRMRASRDRTLSNEDLRYIHALAANSKMEKITKTSPMKDRIQKALVQIANNILNLIQTETPPDKELRIRYYLANQEEGKDAILSPLNDKGKELKESDISSSPAVLHGRVAEADKAFEGITDEFMGQYENLYRNTVSPLMERIKESGTGQNIFDPSQTEANRIVDLWVSGDIASLSRMSPGERRKFFEFLDHFMRSSDKRFQPRVLSRLEGQSEAGKERKVQSQRELIFNLALYSIATQLYGNIMTKGTPEMRDELLAVNKTDVQDIGIVTLNQKFDYTKFGNLADGASLTATVVQGLGMYYCGLTAVVNLIIALQDWHNFDAYLPHIALGAAGCWGISKYGHRLTHFGDKATNFMRFEVAKNPRLRRIFGEFMLNPGSEREMPLIEMINWKDVRMKEFQEQEGKRRKNTVTSAKLKELAPGLPLRNDGDRARFQTEASLLSTPPGDEKNERRYELYSVLAGNDFTVHEIRQMAYILHEMK